MDDQKKAIVKVEYALAGIALATAVLTFYKVYMTYQKLNK